MMTKIAGCKNRIKRRLYHVRRYSEGLTADWEGTFWKDKNKVKAALQEQRVILNKLYDELDLLTGITNERTMI